MFESIRCWMNNAKFWYAILACYLCVLGFLSLNPWIRPVSTDEIFSPDKLDHAFAYGGLSIITFFCLAHSRKEYVRSTGRVWITAMIISTLIGILIEVAQSLFTYNRTGSVEDAVANAVGAGIGCLSYHLVKYMMNLLAMKSTGIEN